VSDVQRIGDELEIGSLLARYARAVDARDWTLYRSVFTHDATIDYSAVGVTATALDDVVNALADLVAEQSASMHYVTNVESHVDNDIARVHAMWLNAATYHNDSTIGQHAGRWHHDMVRTSGGWRSHNLRLEVLA
jgi:ketosteroid isomerase-like protein